MQMFANGKLTNVKTIERMRRKLQEECPELRGKIYVARKGTIQDKWRKDLGYENNQQTKKRKMSYNFYYVKLQDPGK